MNQPEIKTDDEININKRSIKNNDTEEIMNQQKYQEFFAYNKLLKYIRLCSKFLLIWEKPFEKSTQFPLFDFLRHSLN